MKKFLLLTVFFLTACGPSQEEKQHIATVTCNVMAESTTMDGAMKIREVNQARERIGESPFLAASNEIQESLRYEVCESLVLNDPDYSDLLEAKKLKEEQKFKNFIQGFWISSNVDKEMKIFTAEFVNENAIFTTYKESSDEQGKVFKDQNIYEYTRLDDQRIAVLTGGGSSNFLIKIDTINETLTTDEKLYSRAPNILIGDLQGRWLEDSSDDNYQQFWLTDMRESFEKIPSVWLHLDHSNKTYEEDAFLCSRDMVSGFIIREICNPDEEPGLLFAKTSKEIS